MHITISDDAAGKIADLLESEQEELGKDVFLRVSVSGGGCSGFQYTFSFDAKQTADDILFEHRKARVVIDTISLEYLNGSKIDFKKELIGSALVITDNPNATSSCGCGGSFSIF